ncbi:cyclin-D3-3-like [Lycium barbarum]|uniref:cyclin-D3-3-like n=1 Tax=Lycium barbarum TaxID=112863 RepID=UPI00293E6707|nr:cyclin-D3-3-like [Lycium barbarum]
MAHYHYQKLPFLLDSLYCKDENFQVLKTKSICLSEQDMIWEKEELISLLSKEQENQMYNVVINSPFLSVSRNEAVEWILEAIGYHNFSAQTAILAVNYLDRFLFSFQSQIEKPWMNQLVAVTCLSLAAKVEETQVPLLLDLQLEESRYLFEPRTIQRMELLVLSTLKWKMNPVTPFSFLDYFSRRLGLNNNICYELLRRCERVLLATITDCRFMCCLPSAMAAATMLHVIDVLEPCIGGDYQEQLLGILGIVKGNVTDCYKLIQEVASNIDFNSNKRKFGALPGSPIGVMDVSFSSASSNDLWVVDASVSYSPEPSSKKTKT